MARFAVGEPALGCIFPAKTGAKLRTDRTVHLIYVDDSGSVSNARERFFVLAGVAIFERRLFHLITSLDDVVRGFNLGDPHDVELHGSPMYSGSKEPWHSVRRASREEMIQKALNTIIDGRTMVKLFAAVIDKQAASPKDPIELAFEEVSNRFNLFRNCPGSVIGSAYPEL